MSRKYIFIEVMLVFICMISFVFAKTRYLDSSFYSFYEPLTLCNTESLVQYDGIIVLDSGSVIYPFGVSETDVFFYLEGDSRRQSLSISCFQENSYISEYVHEKQAEINTKKQNAVAIGLGKALVACVVVGVLLSLLLHLRIDDRYKRLIVYTVILGTIILALIFWCMALSTR